MARLLQILAVPGRYPGLLAANSITIASVVSLSSCPFGLNPLLLSDAQVAGLLADKGLTVRVADDSWQFCRHYLSAQVTEPDTFAAGQLVELFRSVEAASAPPGLNPYAIDWYPRTVPGKTQKPRRDTNRCVTIPGSATHVRLGLLIYLCPENDSGMMLVHSHHAPLSSTMCPLCCITY